MDPTSLGDRMKLYEAAEAGRRLMPLLPVIARIDGRSFSRFTRDMKRPYDERMSRLMIDTTRFLVEETCALIGYTQSDEISLLWHSSDTKSQVFFDGRVQKMTSVLAGLSTAYFNRALSVRMPEHADALPVFDCRVWNVPTREEAANTFLWREQDATKNSISMAARAYYSHEELHGRSGRQMQALLLEKDVNWNDYPRFFKRGTFVQRRSIRRAFTAAELDALPPKHHARTEPELEVERSETVELELPPLGRVQNRVEVLFEGAHPISGEEPDED